MNEKRRRFQQTFSRTEKPYVLDVVTEFPVEGEELDLQELRNSCYDDTFYSRLEEIFGGIDVRLDDKVVSYADNSTGSRLDRIQGAVDDLNVLRDHYAIPAELSITDAINALKSKEIYKKEVTGNAEEDEQTES